MINHILVYACFSVSMLMQAMEVPCLQLSSDPNTALLHATINGKTFDKKALSNIELLFDLGADPNYVSPLCGITPLMRAIRVNSPELVQMLLEKKAKVNVADPRGTFVRDFNLIYSRQEVVPIVASITNNMRRIKMHNTINCQSEINCREAVYSMEQSQIIRNAVLIDKILEDHRAYSDVLVYKHPLIIMLQYSCVRQALSYVFTHHMKDLPEAIRCMLCNNKVVRAASMPDLF